METRPRILIIDDDVKLARLLQEYLEPFGYVVDMIHNGEDGLKQVMRLDYAAVILDVMLPAMSGYEVLREIRKQSAVPVLMLTALGDEADRIAGLEVGADDYLPKTFSTNELLARIRAVLRRSSLTTEEHKELHEGRQDLDQARDIQRAFLPRQIPYLEGYEISGVWLPAKTVGGDYYDVVQVGAGKVAFCIGDVAGKGMPAALLMANVQAAVKAFALENVSPAELCHRVNGNLCGNVAQGRYITFFYGVIDGAANRLAYTCAGHNPPLLIRSGGARVRLDRGGTVLGLFPGWSYETAEIDLGAGDTLLLFTDGVTEALSPAGEEFGEERLFRAFAGQPGLSAGELQNAVIQAVSDFCGHNFHDDVTVLALRRR